MRRARGGWVYQKVEKTFKEINFKKNNKTHAQGGQQTPSMIAKTSSHWHIIQTMLKIKGREKIHFYENEIFRKHKTEKKMATYSLGGRQMWRPGVTVETEFLLGGVKHFQNYAKVSCICKYIE